MIIPVADRWLLAGIDIQIAIQKIPEILASRIDVFAIAIDKIHRHVEHIVCIAFIAKAIFKYEGQHAGARGIGIGPNM